MRRAFAFLPAAALLGASPVLAGTLSGAMVERVSPEKIAVTWTDADPVDVMVAQTPDMKGAMVASRADADGRHEIASSILDRHYIALRDIKSGQTVKIAERVLPLSQGSNFRDLGGYSAAGGKHVRWGMIYRSGATPLLSEADVAEIKDLGLKNMVDLRSSEERVLAPSRIEGVTYSAIGYSMTRMMPTDPAQLAQPSSMGNLYGAMPEFFAPHVRLVFDKMLSGEGPVAYNCSAGQDRTGFVSAMVLSALGASRDTIRADYHLSTTWRRPQYEMPKIDPALHPNNPVVAMFSRFANDPAAATPRPLKTADGTAFIDFAIAATEKKWGSVDGYLKQEIGLTDADIAKLRADYLE